MIIPMKMAITRPYNRHDDSIINGNNDHDGNRDYGEKQDGDDECDYDEDGGEDSKSLFFILGKKFKKILQRTGDPI